MAFRISPGRVGASTDRRARAAGAVDSRRWPAIRELPERSRRWIGSSNQRVHFLAAVRADVRAGGSRTRSRFDSWTASSPSTASRRRRRSALADIERVDEDGPEFEASSSASLERRVAADHAKAFVKSPLAEPTCLGRDAVDLVKDTLAKGVTLLLAREGWQPDRFLRGGQARFGRLWERTPAAELGLEFSPNTLTLLLRLTAVDFEAPTDAAGAPAITVGDALVEMLAYRLFRRTAAERFLHLRCRPWALSALLSWCFPEGQQHHRPGTLDGGDRGHLVRHSRGRSLSSGSKSRRTNGIRVAESDARIHGRPGAAPRAGRRDRSPAEMDLARFPPRRQ